MPAGRREHRLMSVREAILAHLGDNPEAADTVDGIQRAWLGGAAALDEVEDAIELLVAQGLVVRRLLPDGGVLYAGPAGGHE